MIKNFWQNKKVLVTGASGFVGSHLIKKLIDSNSQVMVINHSDIVQNKVINQNYINKIKINVLGNIENKQLVFDFFEKYQPDYCFHLAAQPLVEIGEKDPIPTFETNIMGTTYILEAARLNNIKGVILASTAHVYGENKVPLLEKYFPRPSRPYETSKACADMLAQTYAKFYKVPVAIARFVNIYGPGDNNKRLVPRTINLLDNNKSPVIFNKKIIRDFLYIEDAVNAYLTLAENIKKININKDNIIFNFGSGKQYSVEAVINLIIKLMNKNKIKPIYKDNMRFEEIRDQYLDVDKANKVLNWQAKYNLEKGLEKTITWYLDNT